MPNSSSFFMNAPFNNFIFLVSKALIFVFLQTVLPTLPQNRCTTLFCFYCIELKACKSFFLNKKKKTEASQLSEYKSFRKKKAI